MAERAAQLRHRVHLENEKLRLSNLSNSLRTEKSKLGKELAAPLAASSATTCLDTHLSALQRVS